PLSKIPFYLLALILVCALGIHAQQTQTPPPTASPQAAAAPAAGQDMQETVTVEDVARTFVVHLPKSYDSKQKYPVVLVLHDADNDALDMIRLSHFDATADEH